MDDILKPLVVIVIILLLIWLACRYKSRQGFAILPSNYGLSPMNRGVGFVKPYSIQVEAPAGLSEQQKAELVASSEQQVLAQQSPDLQFLQISPEESQKLSSEVQVQIDQQTKEIEELLSWWRSFESELRPSIRDTVYSLSGGFLQDSQSIQHYGLSQDHINVLRELKNRLQDISPENIKTYDDAVKQIIPVFVEYQNEKLDSVYEGMYKYDWATVV